MGSCDNRGWVCRRPPATGSYAERSQLRPERRPANQTLVRRGEIWWVNLDPTQGSEIRKTRPAVVLTANGINRARRTIVVVPLSTGPQLRPPIVIALPS